MINIFSAAGGPVTKSPVIGGGLLARHMAFKDYMQPVGYMCKPALASASRVISDLDIMESGVETAAGCAVTHIQDNMIQTGRSICMQGGKQCRGCSVAKLPQPWTKSANGSVDEMNGQWLWIRGWRRRWRWRSRIKIGMARRGWRRSQANLEIPGKVQVSWAKCKVCIVYIEVAVPYRHPQNACGDIIRIEKYGFHIRSVRHSMNHVVIEKPATG